MDEFSNPKAIKRAQDAWDKLHPDNQTDKATEDAVKLPLSMWLQRGLPVTDDNISRVQKLEAIIATQTTELEAAYARIREWELEGLKHIAAEKKLAESQALVAALRETLQFYADQNHFIIADENAWDTVSGEPPNLWCDEAGTATVEDGSIAKHALSLPQDDSALRTRLREEWSEVAKWFFEDRSYYWAAKVERERDRRFKEGK